MTLPISYGRMTTLSMHEGTINAEDDGTGGSAIVVRIPMSHEQASDVYYQLGNFIA